MVHGPIEYGWSLNISLRPISRTLTDSTTPGQSRPGSDANEYSLLTEHDVHPIWLMFNGENHWWLINIDLLNFNQKKPEKENSSLINPSNYPGDELQTTSNIFVGPHLFYCTDQNSSNHFQFTKTKIQLYCWFLESSIGLWQTTRGDTSPKKKRSNKP